MDPYSISAKYVFILIYNKIIYLYKYIYLFIHIYIYIQLFRTAKTMTYEPILLDLKKLCEDLSMPDYVIQCKIKKDNQIAIMNRLNFTIQLL